MILKKFRILISSVKTVNCSLLTTGNIEHLYGAIRGENLKYYLYASLYLNECSIRDYKILPIPKDGSITLGVNFSSITLTVFFSNLTRLLFKTISFPSMLKVYKYIF